MRKLKGVLAVLILALFMLPVTGIFQEAKAIRVEIIIYIGLTDKCEYKGICDIDVIIDGVKVLDRVVPVKGDVEVKDDNLLIKFNEKFPADAVSPDGTYTVNIKKDKNLANSVASQLGFKKLVLKKGSYKVDGNSVLIKIAEKSKLEKPRQQKD